jgi:hypothetical protein
MPFADAPGITGDQHKKTGPEGLRQLIAVLPFAALWRFQHRLKAPK